MNCFVARLEKYIVNIQPTVTAQHPVGKDDILDKYMKHCQVDVQEKYFQT